ncbi:MAG: hypothetical protein JWM36_3199 [Hyphomicrobiales bacterium]|nr:hypothetical protein [Hyphomicrobiales bacterium]
MIALILLAYFVGFIASFVYWQTKAEREDECPDTVSSLILAALWPMIFLVFIVGLLSGLAFRTMLRAIG